MAATTTTAPDPVGRDLDDELHIISWNMNGLRTFNMSEILTKRVGTKNCSILAIQETKLTRNMLEAPQACVDDYTSYFSFSKNRSGYSGVANYCHTNATPIRAEDGIAGSNFDPVYKDDPALAVGNYPDIGEDQCADAKYGDNDGRTVITQHVVIEPDGSEKLLNVINVYCPRLRDDPSDPVNNRQFKLNFHNFLTERARNMLKTGQFVVLLGDLNVSHKIEDQSDVAEPKQFIHHEFRQWLDDLLSRDEESGAYFVDTFRLKHPDRPGSFTCWNTRLNARQNNYGARIDYILVDSSLSKYLTDAQVHQDIFGSDHCPVSATFHSIRFKANGLIPPCASKFYPQFYHRQPKLNDLFKPRDAQAGKTNSIQNETNHKKRVVKQTSLTSFLVKKPKLEELNLIGGPENDQNSIAKSTPDNGSSGFITEVNAESVSAWRLLFKPPDTPTCTGHGEKCSLRKVSKEGVNVGRQFWVCPRGVGKPGDKNASCNFFKWANSKSS